METLQINRSGRSALGWMVPRSCVVGFVVFALMTGWHAAPAQADTGAGSIDTFSSAIAMITVDGQPVSMTASTSGGYNLVFTGDAQQRVSLSIALPASACYGLSIQNPDGTYLVNTSSAACSTGYASPVLTLPQNGTYMIHLNPLGTVTGQAKFFLRSSS